MTGPSMADVLIVYASTNGHTARVAARLAGALEAAGVRGRLEDVRAIPAGVSPRDHDGVIVAGSVHRGRHQREIADWVRAHHTTLALRRTALVSVSLSAADESPEARADVRRVVDELVEDTDWTPGVVAFVAGALRFGDYDLPTRVLMRLIARRHGVTGDLVEDVEFTDWAELDRFACEFAGTVLRSAQPV
jgi:menaquinone-dependent protoporphyrinogen oxidase